MATLINGNGNPRIYAAQDADLIASLAGDVTGIAQVGNQFAATALDANTITVADGVIVTKEGRRIQLDAGSTDSFTIPTGTAGQTNYYIIGYKLSVQLDNSQKCETFVQLMSSSTETIPEDTFRNGATEVYVSLYRVEQDGINMGSITGLLEVLNSISQLNNDLSDKVSGFTETTYSAVTGLAYDSTNKKLGLKVGADTVIPFNNGISNTFSYSLVNNKGGNTDVDIFIPQDVSSITINYTSKSSYVSTGVYVDGTYHDVTSSPITYSVSSKITLHIYDQYNNNSAIFKVIFND